MSKYLIVVIIVLLAVVGVMWNHVRSADERWETAMANVKAYDAQLAESGKKNVALQLTVDQLGGSAMADTMTES